MSVFVREKMHTYLYVGMEGVYGYVGILRMYVEMEGVCIDLM